VASRLSGSGQSLTDYQGLDPVKPIRPGPYTLHRNRRFVIGIAIVLVIYPLLRLLFWLSVEGTSHMRGDLLALLVIAALSFFLVQGHHWAQRCLLLYFIYAALGHFIGWSSLQVTTLKEMEIYRFRTSSPWSSTLSWGHISSSPGG
jgi:hypothetical protein